MRANVYRITDPTSDSLHRLGTVDEAGAVLAYERPAGRVAETGHVFGPDGTAVGRADEGGAIYRDGSAQQIGYVSREGSVYRGAALVPQAAVGYVDPRVPRPHMGGAALLLGLLD